MVIQGYDRINWEDLPSQATPINAENLNHMEDGIENLYAAIGDIDLDAIAADIAEVKEEVENFQPGVELTQEEYDDLTEEEKNNGTIYYIKDGDASAITAADAHYDNSTSGLTATDVQGAVDEVQGEIDVLNSNRVKLFCGNEYTGTTSSTSTKLSEITIQEPGVYQSFPTGYTSIYNAYLYINGNPTAYVSAAPVLTLKAGDVVTLYPASSTTTNWIVYKLYLLKIANT